jgi:predicted AlkP superfamily pyrophosphatase or phosphodiesterase
MLEVWRTLAAVLRLRRFVRCALLLALAASALQAADRPILILISIDGWRWDYLDRFKPPTLTRLASRGVLSDGLIPVFPSKTFPNHYTIVTGLYPERHGIVSNSMIDRALPGSFTLGNVDALQDTRWWGGVPLWVTVEQQGQIAGTMFWPGSDVEIAGDRPSYWQQFDANITNTARVDQILDWLRNPDASRPTFLTLYFEEVDTAGHDIGPDRPEMGSAIEHIDAAMARLVAGIDSTGLAPRTNLLIVSDHGMSQGARERTIVLDEFVDVSSLTVIDWSPILGVAPRWGTVDELHRALKGRHASLEVFKNEELPAKYRLAGHPRYPPIIGIADDGWEVTSRARLARDQGKPGGTHGYDPIHRSMHGLFLAVGPAFHAGVKAPRFENVHVYELMCRVLGIRPAPNDGDPAVTAGFLK